MALFPVRNIHIRIISFFHISVDPDRNGNNQEQQNRYKLFRSLFPGVIPVAVIKKVDNKRNQRVKKIRNHFRYFENKRTIDFHSDKFRCQYTKNKYWGVSLCFSTAFVHRRKTSGPRCPLLSFCFSGT